MTGELEKAIGAAERAVEAGYRPRWAYENDSDLAEFVTATVHPSSILRGEPDEREAAFAAFVDDLRVVASALAR